MQEVVLPETTNVCAYEPKPEDLYVETVALRIFLTLIDPETELTIRDRDRRERYDREMAERAFQLADAFLSVCRGYRSTDIAVSADPSPDEPLD